MFELPNNIKDAIQSFSKLPGVGERTAQRQVMAMTKWDYSALKSFAQSIEKLTMLKYCQDCGMFSDEDLCQICNNFHRKDSKLLCIVENINDLMAIEKSGTFRGLYHVLGGVLNPLAGIGPQELKIEKLISRVREMNIETIILAINPSVEGDATCSYLKQTLGNVHVERIGFGIPIGGSLEFLDPLTISKALENRKVL